MQVNAQQQDIAFESVVLTKERWWQLGVPSLNPIHEIGAKKKYRTSAEFHYDKKCFLLNSYGISKIQWPYKKPQPTTKIKKTVSWLVIIHTTITKKTCNFFRTTIQMHQKKRLKYTPCLIQYTCRNMIKRFQSLRLLVKHRHAKEKRLWYYGERIFRENCEVRISEKIEVKNKHFTAPNHDVSRFFTTVNPKNLDNFLAPSASWRIF